MELRFALAADVGGASCRESSLWNCVRTRCPPCWKSCCGPRRRGQGWPALTKQ